MKKYLITSDYSRLQGIGLRYRLMQIGIRNKFEVKAKNLSDNRVEFEVEDEVDIKPIIEFLKDFRPDVRIILE